MNGGADLQQLLQETLALHQAGRLGEAIAGYQRILELEPRHSDALHLLGVIAQQQGKLDISIELIQAAVAINSGAAIYHNSLGNCFLKKGQVVESMECFRQAILLNPRYIEAHWGMGNALAALEQPELAAEAYQQVIALKPRFSAAHYNLGRMLNKLGKREAAIACYQSAIQLEGTHPEYFFNLGSVCRFQGKSAEAIQAFRCALALQPHDAECLRLLGELLVEQGSYEEAELCLSEALKAEPRESQAYFHLGLLFLKTKEWDRAQKAFREAIAIDSTMLEAHYNLGNVLREKEQLEEAIECYETAIDLARSAKESSPALATACSRALCNLGLSRAELGDTETAISLYRESLQLEPCNAETHCNLAYALLSTGQFPEGLAEMEWRNQKATNAPRRFEAPLWMGESLEGKSILIHAEQGLGDSIQFVRYVPMLLERGAKVVLDVQRSLAPLLRQSFPSVQVLESGEPLPAFDLHCPLMSLPRAFGTTLETVPSPSPYLQVSKETVSSAWEKMARPGFRVGIAWCGNPQNPNDAVRSTSLPNMVCLAEVPGVTLYSLQVGDVAEQISTYSVESLVVDAGRGWTNFADTAAFLAGLDLVICVDTSVAHLAGALGLDVWILISSRRSDWRWLRDRGDSPWYKSARLFRQERPGDWKGLLEIVKNSLQKLVITRSSAPDGEKLQCQS